MKSEPNRGPSTCSQHAVRHVAPLTLHAQCQKWFNIGCCIWESSRVTYEDAVENLPWYFCDALQTFESASAYAVAAHCCPYHVFRVPPILSHTRAKWGWGGKELSTVKGLSLALGMHSVTLLLVVGSPHQCMHSPLQSCSPWEQFSRGRSKKVSPLPSFVVLPGHANRAASASHNLFCQATMEIRFCASTKCKQCVII